MHPRQLEKVRDYMVNHGHDYQTLEQIGNAVNMKIGLVSAYLIQLQLPRFGQFEIEKEPRQDGNRDYTVYRLCCTKKKKKSKSGFHNKWAATKQIRQIDVVREFLFGLAEDQFATIDEIMEHTGIAKSNVQSYLGQLRLAKFGSYKFIRRTRELDEKVDGRKKIFEYRIAKREDVYDDCLLVDLDEKKIKEERPEDPGRLINKEDDRRFAISELSQITGSSRSSIHRWLNDGSLHGPKEDDVKQTSYCRKFDRTHIVRIKQLQKFFKIGIGANQASSYIDHDKAPSVKVSECIDRILNELPQSKAVSRCRKRLLQLARLVQKKTHLEYNPSFDGIETDIEDHLLIDIPTFEEYNGSRFNFQTIADVIGLTLKKYRRWSNLGLIHPPHPKVKKITPGSKRDRVYKLLLTGEYSHGEIVQLAKVPDNDTGWVFAFLRNLGVLIKNGPYYSAIEKNDIYGHYSERYDISHLQRAYALHKLTTAGVEIKGSAEYLDQEIPIHLTSRIRACFHDIVIDPKKLRSYIARIDVLLSRIEKRVRCLYDPDRYLSEEDKNIISFYAIPDVVPEPDSSSEYDEDEYNEPIDWSELAG